MKEQSKQNEQFSQTPVSGSRYVPMLFSTEMVEAILNGTKNQTRRIIKFPKDFDTVSVFDNGALGLKYSSNLFDGELKRLYPKLEFGDIIWVRETFTIIPPNLLFYKADNVENAKHVKWKPSLFMPKKACRLFLQVVSVTCERLNDISENDAKGEGVEDFFGQTDINSSAFRDYMVTKKEIKESPWNGIVDNAIDSYKSLWEKINGKGRWELNPWVWVYKFERIDRPHDYR